MKIFYSKALSNIKRTMFTGIIEEIGKVEGAVFIKGVRRICISAENVSLGLKQGDSVSVDGVCLTAVEIKSKLVCFDVMAETLRNTTIGNLRPGAKVNLERALKASDRIGGHFVTGHVDCVGLIRLRKITRGNLEFNIAVPTAVLRYLVIKGSIAVSGISLTISNIKSGTFSVCIIPHTAKATTLGKMKTGDKVNIEVDMLAKKRF